jgi:urease accessory protein
MKIVNHSTRTAFRILAAISAFLPLHEASAHMLIGEKIPHSHLQGFFSGLAHPLTGLDHLAFVIAIGLLSLRLSRGMVLPAFFLLAALAGMGLHMMYVNLPGSEMAVAISVMLSGLLLVLPIRIPLLGMACMVGLAGIAHGYAYNEPMAGAGGQTTGLFLTGLIGMQLALVLIIRSLGKKVFVSQAAYSETFQRVLGLGVGSVGLMFLVLAAGY